MKILRVEHLQLTFPECERVFLKRRFHTFVRLLKLFFLTNFTVQILFNLSRKFAPLRLTFHSLGYVLKQPYLQFTHVRPRVPFSLGFHLMELNNWMEHTEAH